MLLMWRVGAHKGMKERTHPSRTLTKMIDPAIWPRELRLHKDRKTLAVTFDNGQSFDLSAEYLRVKSPSAEVQGHSPDERKLVAGKKNVTILEVQPVGNYAVRLVFDDLHTTGIYSWDYLHELGREHTRNWQDYLDELAQKNQSREPLRGVESR
jgi:DUF971 family protein